MWHLSSCVNEQFNVFYILLNNFCFYQQFVYRVIVYRAAYLGKVVPLLFVIFSDKFNITLEKLSLLITINFATQLIVDTLSIKFADIIGYKKLAFFSQFIAFIGLSCLGILPNIMENAYAGIVISIILSAIGSGITEVIISPIVEGIDCRSFLGLFTYAFKNLEFSIITSISSIFFTYSSLFRNTWGASISGASN